MLSHSPSAVSAIGCVSSRSVIPPHKKVCCHDIGLHELRVHNARVAPRKRQGKENTALITFLLGKPKETLLAPKTRLSPQRRFTISMVSKVVVAALLLTALDSATQSAMILSRSIPRAPALSTISVIISSLLAAEFGTPDESDARATKPYYV